jgi:hypothetical protein
MDCSAASNVLQCRKFEDRMIEARDVVAALSAVIGMLTATAETFAQTPPSRRRG